MLKMGSLASWLNTCWGEAWWCGGVVEGVILIGGVVEWFSDLIGGVDEGVILIGGVVEW